VFGDFFLGLAHEPSVRDVHVNLERVGHLDVHSDGLTGGAHAALNPAFFPRLIEPRGAAAL
jgi:hypothetical protein